LWWEPVYDDRARQWQVVGFDDARAVTVALNVTENDGLPDGLTALVLAVVLADATAVTPDVAALIAARHPRPGGAP
jgi:hypothetical protein